MYTRYPFAPSLLIAASSSAPAVSSRLHTALPRMSYSPARRRSNVENSTVSPDSQRANSARASSTALAVDGCGRMATVGSRMASLPFGMGLRWREVGGEFWGSLVVGIHIVQRHGLANFLGQRDQPPGLIKSRLDNSPLVLADGRLGHAKPHGEFGLGEFGGRSKLQDRVHAQIISEASFYARILEAVLFAKYKLYFYRARHV